MSASGIKSGASWCGPRRLMMWVEMPPAAGRNARRNGAGDASAAALIGRTSQKNVSVVCAARLSRRSASSRILVCHSSTAPQLPLRKICSVDQRASAVLGARIQSKFGQFKSMNLQAAELGKYGGCTKAIRRCCESCANIGRNKCISPMPACCTSNSVKVDWGQPFPGSSSSSMLCPVAMVLVTPRLSSLARQTLRSMAQLASGVVLGC